MDYCWSGKGEEPLLKPEPISFEAFTILQVAPGKYYDVHHNELFNLNGLAKWSITSNPLLARRFDQLNDELVKQAKEYNYTQAKYVTVTATIRVTD